MRTLEACREEIFLRSRQRIRRRNKIRWAVGTACIPLILVAVLLLPGSPKGTESPLAEAVPDGAPPITAMGDITVSVRLPGAEEAIPADPELAAQLEGCFIQEEMATEPPKERPESAPLTGGDYSNGKSENYGSGTPILITCQKPGRELNFILKGNELTCEEFSQTVTLSHDQRSRLEAYWLTQRKERIP